MRCECCKKVPATIQVRDVSEWKVADIIHVCDSCAQLIVPHFLVPQKKLVSVAKALEKGQESFQEMNTSVLPGEKEDSFTAWEPSQEQEIKCKECGTSFKDFQKTGRLGCEFCYESFRDLLDPILKRVHGVLATQHQGHVPEAPEASSPSLLRKQVQMLQKELQIFVQTENYERAAELRDKIMEMEEKLQEKDTKS